jgi:hypothetical protein
MNRIPLILRTPKNNFNLNDLKQSIAKGYNLGYSQDAVLEINLRSLFAESYGHPLKK